MRPLFLVVLLASVCHAELSSKPKYKSAGHSFQGQKVCILVDEGRNIQYCATPKEIQACMDAGSGTCHAQLIDSSSPVGVPTVRSCTPAAPAVAKKARGVETCRPVEFKQYRFRYGSNGATNAVLY